MTNWLVDFFTRKSRRQSDWGGSANVPLTPSRALGWEGREQESRPVKKVGSSAYASTKRSSSASTQRRRANTPPHKRPKT